ncbi:MAG: hypothetical protein KME31_32235 [Tolypothrix carrinoi HA7290-LM1]|nr:hypothetical protein [Tolypothrix carrinoi HA7290-LM1]
MDCTQVQLPPLHQQADWLGLLTVVMVVRVRHLWDKTTREVQFYQKRQRAGGSYAEGILPPALEV